MDATLLRLSYSLQTSDEVHSLAFRDLTIDGHGNGRLFTPRGPAAIRLERCRVVGFRDMLDGNQAAFHAVSCRFEAGFGDPAFDRLFQLRAGVLRLDDCVIQGPFESICDSGRATCLFSRCEILDAPARQRSRLESPPAGVRFEGCRVTYQPADVPARQPRPLTDLNPAWKD